MKLLATVTAVLTSSATVLAQPTSPASALESSDIVAAAIGATITAVLGAMGYAVRELVLKTRERRANRAVFELLHAMLDRVKNEAGSDWLAPWGLYYRHQLSSELARLARDKRDLIGGDTFLDLVRLSAALRAFSFDRSHEDSGVYSVDELIQETCVTLKRIVPRAIQSVSKRNQELDRIEETRKLMITGVGAFVPISKPSSNAADMHA